MCAKGIDKNTIVKEVTRELNLELEYAEFIISKVNSGRARLFTYLRINEKLDM